MSLSLSSLGRGRRDGGGTCPPEAEQMPSKTNVMAGGTCPAPDPTLEKQPGSRVDLNKLPLTFVIKYQSI